MRYRKLQTLPSLQKGGNIISMLNALHNRHFWTGFVVSGLVLSALFAWELGMMTFLPSLPRPEATSVEMIYTVIMILLLSFDSGLVLYRLKQGTCPLGAKRASTIAGGLGIITLLCPACLLIPISLFGITLSLTFLTPFLPLLRLIVVLLLIVSTMLLWPKK